MELREEFGGGLDWRGTATAERGGELGLEQGE